MVEPGWRRLVPHTGMIVGQVWLKYGLVVLLNHHCKYEYRVESSSVVSECEISEIGVVQDNRTTSKDGWEGKKQNHCDSLKHTVIYNSYRIKPNDNFLNMVCYGTVFCSVCDSMFKVPCLIAKKHRSRGEVG